MTKANRTHKASETATVEHSNPIGDTTNTIETGENTMSDSNVNTAPETTIEAAPVADPLADLFEGVNLASTDVSELVKEIERRKQALVAAMDELKLAQNCPDKMATARKMAESMLGLNLSRAAVHSALESQFGKVQAKRGPKPGSTREGNAEHLLITHNLPTITVQESILAAIVSAGEKGISMESLRATFQDVSDPGLVGTVKNALTKGQIRSTGVTRGMKYHPAIVPVATDTAPTATDTIPQV